MKKNTQEKALVEMQDGILKKIKNFFRNLFYVKSDKKINETVGKGFLEEEKTVLDPGLEFKRQIKVDTKKESLRILKMKQELETGEKVEEEFCEQELEELREYYIQQIKIKKEKIQINKERILHIKALLS